MANDTTDGVKPYEAKGNSLQEVLADTSQTGKPRPWRKQKLTSRAVGASMLRIWRNSYRKKDQFKRRGMAIYGCSERLAFGTYVDAETGELGRRLDAANFCRDRLCPMCQWRKSLVAFGNVSKCMDWVDARYPVAPLFLTLTMRNVNAPQLGDGIGHILKAWSRMMNKAGNRRPYHVSRGWFRALEITYNAQAETWHPHIHAVVLVDPDYFSDAAKYIDHDRWVDEWRWALRSDYDPTVDVRTIKGDRADAVAEVAKYAVKPGEWVSDDYDTTDENVELLATVLRNRRLTAFGGVMAEARKALALEDEETADLVNTDSGEIRGDVRVALETYQWQAGVTNDYVLVERRRELPEG